MDSSMQIRNPTLAPRSIGRVVMVSALATMAILLFAHRMAGLKRGSDGHYAPVTEIGVGTAGCVDARGLAHGPLMVSTGRDPYKVRDTNGLPYVYPPAIISLIWPLDFRDFERFCSQWRATLLFAAILSVLLLGGLVPGRYGVGVLAGGVMLFSSASLLFAMERGNYDLIPLVMISLSLVLFRSGREFAGGTAIALATLVKVYPGILLWPLIVSRRWRAVAGATTAGLIGITLIFPRFQWDYFTNHLWQWAAIVPAHYTNHSIPSFFSFFFHAPRLGMVMSLLTFLGYLVSIFVTTRGRQTNPECCVRLLAASLPVMIVLPGVSWDYNLVLVTPLAVLLLVDPRVFAGLCEQVAALAAGVALAIVIAPSFADVSLASAYPLGAMAPLVIVAKLLAMSRTPALLMLAAAALFLAHRHRASFSKPS